MKISKRNKVILCAVLIAIVACIFSLFYVVFGSYDGLGLPKKIPQNPYDQSAFYEEKGMLRYEDHRYTSLVGIDVSYYQNHIDWEKVKESGVDFAMIRLGYRGYSNGNLVLDERFKENLRGAKRAGLDVGVYFFSQAISVEEAIEEARFTIRHIRGRGVTFPVVFDMEPIEGADRINDLTVMEKTKIADAFCEIVEKNGHYAMIYGNPSWLNRHIDRKYLTRHKIWLAHYTDLTDYSFDFGMWQYTDRGKIPGISGRVDLDIYFVEK